MHQNQQLRKTVRNAFFSLKAWIRGGKKGDYKRTASRARRRADKQLVKENHGAG